MTGLSRSSIYRKMAEGTFPHSLPAGERGVGWLKSEIMDWIPECIAERDEQISLKKKPNQRRD
nr:AlpA family phage regulatory protein [Neptunomonas qingdaonensis]